MTTNSSTDANTEYKVFFSHKVKDDSVNSGVHAADTVVIPPGDVDRLVYVAIAGARDDAETDLLAALRAICCGAGRRPR